MVLRATLKKPWLSKRGRRYPTGTDFIKIRDVSSGSWYKFDTHKGKSGFVLIQAGVFELLTEEEIKIRKERDEMFEKHMKACNEFRNLITN
tara:strand:- start:189 stop:461 length:273 start_codon:yes stop_codon:yes gene_type:complete